MVGGDSEKCNSNCVDVCVQTILALITQILKNAALWSSDQNLAQLNVKLVLF